MKKYIFPLAVLFVLTATIKVTAQQFSMPSYDFSKSKTSFFTMKDGSTVEAKIITLNYERGQISALKLRNDSKEKVKVTPEDIDFMYLPQSMADKMNQLDRFMEDSKRWKSDKIDNEKIKDGYVYFESTEVKIGNSVKPYLMQVLNPAFCSNVKVYNDPFTTETMSVGIGNIKLAGGDVTSYYFKKGDQAAFKLTKGDYKKLFSEIWSDCPSIIEKYGEKPKWTDLAAHIYEYTLQKE